MALEFEGAATPFTAGAVEDAAEALGCEAAAVYAVIDVESRGGFLKDKRPKILFERHYFHRLTGGAHDAAHPDVSAQRGGGYEGGAAEYVRLGKAAALNRDAALRSASWGAFQIMGDNCKVAGFADVESFVAAMQTGEDAQLKAFVAFVKANHLDDELRRHDWTGFARGYNGPGYREFSYDTKIGAAYARHAAGARTDPPPAGRTLRQGDAGPDVKALQAKLGLPADGDFGPNTKKAVIAYQTTKGMSADGIVGPQTRRSLGI